MKKWLRKHWGHMQWLDWIVCITSLGAVATLFLRSEWLGGFGWLMFIVGVEMAAGYRALNDKSIELANDLTKSLEAEMKRADSNERVAER